MQEGRRQFWLTPPEQEATYFNVYRNAIGFLVTEIYSRQKAIWLADLHGFRDRSKTGAN